MGQFFVDWIQVIRFFTKQSRFLWKASSKSHFPPRRDTFPTPIHGLRDNFPPLFIESIFDVNQHCSLANMGQVIVDWIQVVRFVTKQSRFLWKISSKSHFPPRRDTFPTPIHGLRDNFQPLLIESIFDVEHNCSLANMGQVIVDWIQVVRFVTKQSRFPWKTSSKSHFPPRRDTFPTPIHGLRDNFPPLLIESMFDVVQHYSLANMGQFFVDWIQVIRFFTKQSRFLWKTPSKSHFPPRRDIFSTPIQELRDKFPPLLIESMFDVEHNCSLANMGQVLVDWIQDVRFVTKKGVSMENIVEKSFPTPSRYFSHPYTRVKG
ncbi:hypothetical protein IV203_025052 [Nitzschia inconspicua]|nr:hypothetical protein IV203_025052 [Nitzschia inconspicua]